MGFNGAATLSLRKYLVDKPLYPKTALLQWGRNFIVAEIPSLPIRSATSYWLQWGRNFIVAEIANPTVMTPTQMSLQWGRNFIVAEICQRCPDSDRNPHCFNGAATLSLRKLGALSNAQGLEMVLQWGRNFIVAEITIATYGGSQYQ